MATGGTAPLDAYTRYTRIVLSLGKCCTEVERSVLKAFLSYNSQTLDQFLQQNKTKVQNKRNGNHHQRLYFPLNQNADLEEWDLGAVCFILTDFTSIPQQQKDDICHLRRIRNKICHCSRSDLLDEKEYLSYKDDIQKIIDGALGYVNDSGFRQHIEEQIKEIEQGEFTAAFKDSLQQLNTWNEVVEELNQGMLITHGKLNQILSLMQGSIPPVKSPGYTADLEMQNCSVDQETNLTERFIDRFNTCIKGKKFLKRLADTDVDELYQTIRTAFKQLKREETTVEAVTPECVRLQISCSSVQILLSLIEDCASGRLTELFEPIETAVRKLPGFSEYRQQVVMHRQDYVDCICTIVESICTAIGKSGTVPQTQVTRDVNNVIHMTCNIGEESTEEVTDIVDTLIGVSKALQIAFEDDELKLEIKTRGEVSQEAISTTIDKEDGNEIVSIDIRGKSNYDGDTSTSTPGPFCDPQQHEGTLISVNGYCDVCKVFMCDSCIWNHQNTSIMSNHQILTGHEMPTDKRWAEKICTEECNQHKGKYLEFYCKTHDTFGCFLCIALHHRLCRVVGEKGENHIHYIPDVVKKFPKSEDYNMLNGTIDGLEESVNQYENKIASVLEQIKVTNDIAVEDIRQIRDQLNTYLDEEEARLLALAEQKRIEATKSVQCIEDQIQIFMTDIADVKSSLYATNKEAVKVIVNIKETWTRCQRLQDDLDAMLKKNMPDVYTFQVSTELQCITALTCPLGELKIVSDTSIQDTNDQDPANMKQRQSLSDLNLSEIEKISVATDEDHDLPYITGMAELNDEAIILTDYYNKAVKVIDKTTHVLDQLVVSSFPMDIAIMPNGKVAITMPESETIQIVSTEERLSLNESFAVNGRCMGICFIDNTFVVTFEEDILSNEIIYNISDASTDQDISTDVSDYSRKSKLEILTLKGLVLKVINPMFDGKPLCSNPQYVRTVNCGDEMCMFVSSVSNETLIKLSKNGKVLAHNIYEKLDSPGSITTFGKKTFLISNNASSTICGFEDDGKKVTNVCQWDLEGVPIAILFSRREEKLYIYYKYFDPWYVHVYKMKTDVND